MSRATLVGLALLVSWAACADTVESAHVKFASFENRITVADDLSFEADADNRLFHANRPGPRENVRFAIFFDGALSSGEILGGRDTPRLQ